ncbi:MAG: methyltransferase domain-containing protein, partial [Myxococcales bacterium]|nr:methyltransferase domain-containing protein [Myxococcales bacterium]
MHDWNARYEAGTTPWDHGGPDPLLVEAVTSGRFPPGRTVEVGCGTGANARFLRARGHEVVGLDLAPTAIARARHDDPDGT